MSSANDYAQQVKERIAQIRERIHAAAQEAGRSPSDVRLIGITKTHPAEAVAAALAAGLCDAGESRVQEAEPKIAALAAERAQLRWHMIGHLQTNKARKAAALFDFVHSVDSVRLAQALSRERAALYELPPLPILLQVNVSGEESKEGFALVGWQERPALFDSFCAEVERILAAPALEVRGLMTIAPYGADPLPTFESARKLRDALAQRFSGATWNELSMGMSDDFAAAIAQGATMVRVGRAIFGERG